MAWGVHTCENGVLGGRGLCIIVNQGIGRSRLASFYLLLLLPFHRGWEERGVCLVIESSHDNGLYGDVVPVRASECSARHLIWGREEGKGLSSMAPMVTRLLFHHWHCRCYWNAVGTTPPELAKIPRAAIMGSSHLPSWRATQS